MILDLELNRNLIPKGHFMRYQLPNGTDAVQHFTTADADLCHYKVRKFSNIISKVSILFYGDVFVLGDD